MTIRDLIPWIRDRDAQCLAAAETDKCNGLHYEMDSKSQNVIIDHSTRTATELVDSDPTPNEDERVVL